MYVLDYQNKFDTTLTRMNIDLPDLRHDLSDLKQNYIKLESELSVARQVSHILKEHIVTLERHCWSNSQYSRRECLEISGILYKTVQKLVVSRIKLSKKICRIHPVDIRISNRCWSGIALDIAMVLLIYLK